MHTGFISHIYENVPLPLFWMRNSDAFMATVNKCYWNIIEASGQLFGKHVLEAMASEMGMVFNKKLRCGYKWADYSYHDFTVSSVIKMLEGNVTQPRPNFLGAIFFELRTMRDGKLLLYLSILWKYDRSIIHITPISEDNNKTVNMAFQEVTGLKLITVLD